MSAARPAAADCTVAVEGRVRIGHDRMVGAGAMVTKSVPPSSMVVETARIVRMVTSEAKDGSDVL